MIVNTWTTGIKTGASLCYFVQYNDADKLTIDTSGNITLSGDLDGITKTEISHLSGVTSNIQTQIDDLNIIPTIAKSLTVTTSWLDTGINGNDLSGTGTYLVRVHVDNHAVGGDIYNERWSGVMSWFSGGSNDTNVDNITLHACGFARNNVNIELRTVRRAGAFIKLQIKTSRSTWGNSTYTFSFRKLI